MKKLFASLLVAAALFSCSSNKSAETQDSAEPAATTAAEDQSLFSPDKVAIGVVELDDDNALRPDIKTNHLMIIDFSATWCGPCQQFKPAFEAAAEKYSGQVEFVSVDVDKNPETAKAFGVQGIPHVTFIVPGESEVKTYIGTGDLLPETKFFELIDQNLK